MQKTDISQLKEELVGAPQDSPADHHPRISIPMPLMSTLASIPHSLVYTPRPPNVYTSIISVQP